MESGTNGVSMTEITYERASSQVFTLSEAISYLKQNANLRTVKESLARYCGISVTDEAALKKRILELLLQSEPDGKRDSMERKIRTWMKDDVQYLGKKAVIQLAYSLGQTVEEADQMLVHLTGERFHWRDPEDIVWGFGLNNRLSFEQAKALSTRLLGKNGTARKPSEQEAVMTAMVKKQALQLHTEAELELFLRNNWAELGKFHNTAYGLFIDFLNVLGLPDAKDFLPSDREMTVKEIVSTYLYKAYIPKANGLGNKQDEIENNMASAIQRDIRQNWPDEIALSRMAHRETDVTRKVLILLFLACDGGESEYADYSDESLEDIFQDMNTRLSCMLNDCGFAPLDARSPFDWMVLYCMCADESIFVDENVQRFLSGIFADGSIVPDEAEEEAVPTLS